MQILYFPIIRICLCLIVGIAAAHILQLPIGLLTNTLALTGVALLLLWLRAHRRVFQDVWFGLVACLFFGVLGAWSYARQLPANQKHHYTHNVSCFEEGVLQFKIDERIKPTRFAHRYVATVWACEGQPTTGKILLNIRRDSLPFHLPVDRVLLARTLPESPRSPRNPHQFDYGRYLRQQGIYDQVYLNRAEIIKERPGKPSLRGRVSSLRDYLVEQLDAYPFEPDERAVLLALLLGQRQDLSPELRADYAAAGAIHILAISGLHVGILMLIFEFLCRPLRRGRYGVWTAVLVTLLLLWGFALLTGLSPSVLRATTMFSFLAVGKQLQRNTNSFNTLACSALVLLLVDPNLLFQVGFQLSYMAVWGILLFYPPLSRLYGRRWWPVRKTGDLLTVSVAAQLGVLPLSLFYFHQFPALFFVTNLLVIPCLGIILGAGLLVVLLAACKLLPLFMAEAYGWTIGLLNRTVRWVAGREGFLFEEIPFSLVQLGVLYGVIGLLGLMVHKSSFGRVAMLLLAGLLFQGTFFYHKIVNRQQQWTVFHSPRNTHIGYRSGTELQVFTPTASDTTLQAGFLKDYRVGKRISKVTVESVPNVLRYGEQEIVVVDSFGILPPKTGKPPIVLLTQSPKLNLERLVDSVRPVQIVADGSNFRSYAIRWRATCRRRGIPFHDTAVDGAFVLN